MYHPAIDLDNSSTVGRSIAFGPLFRRTAISVSALLDPKPTPWAEPEKSIGPFHITIKGEMCWRCKGPAADAFNEVATSIKELLDSHQEYLEDGEEIVHIISFNMWMIGRSAKLARPTIVVTSKSKRSRYKAMELIKKYELLSKWPGVELRTMERLPAVLTMEVSRATGTRWTGVPAVTGRSTTGSPALDPMPPATAVLTRSGNRASVGTGFSAGDTTPPDAGSWPLPAEVGTEVYAIGSPTNACGTPIIVGSSRRRVTLGGVLLVGTTYYGFTVAHARSETEGVEEPDEEGEELAFDDYSDGGNNVADATGNGSVSSESDHGEESDESRSLGTNDNVEIDDADQKSDNESEVSTPATLDSPRQTPHALPEDRVGVAALPDKYEQSDLDYEIFRVTPRRYCNWNNIYPPSTTTGTGGRIVVKGPAKRVLAGSRVWVATGTTGLVMGTIQGSPHYIKMGSGRSFQEMWLVQMDRPTVKGDSGSWVIDPIDGKLYGHLVASDPLTGCAYMIPAFKVFEDLGKKFGQVTLPTRNSNIDFFTDAGPALTQDSSVRTPSGDGARLSARAKSIEQSYMLDLESDLAVAPVPNMAIYECPFPFLGCKEVFYDAEMWRSHAKIHFGGYPPPRHAICCFCDMVFDDPNPDVCWGLRMNHVAAHHMQGDRLHQRRPDHSLMRYMYEIGQMSSLDYQAYHKDGFGPGELIYGGQQAVQPTPGVRARSDYVTVDRRRERRERRRR